MFSIIFAEIIRRFRKLALNFRTFVVYSKCSNSKIRKFPSSYVKYVLNTVATFLVFYYFTVQRLITSTEIVEIEIVL